MEKTTQNICLFGGEYLQMEVTQGNTYTISTCGSGFDTQITLYNSNGGSAVGYNDDACGLQSEIVWTASFSGTLNMLVDKYNCQDEYDCASLSMTLNSLGAGPSACDASSPLTCGVASSFSLASGAGTFNPPSGPWGTPGNEAVFTYTPTATGSYTIAITNNNYYVDLFYQSGSCESFGWTFVDDIFSSASNGVELTAGVTYYFLVDDENTTASSGTIEISCPVLYNPCDDATTLDCETTGSFSLASGGGAFNPSSGPWGTPGNEAVFSFTATETGTHTVAITNNNYYVDLFYQAGSCGSTGWNFVEDIFTSESNGIDMIAGVTYFLLVDDENTTASSGTITVTCPVAAVDPCTAIVDMTCADTYSWSLGAGEGLYNPASGPWGTPGQEVVYSYTPTYTGSYTVTMTNSGYYSDIFVSTSCSVDADWQYIDDVFSSSIITFDELTAGVTYYFLIDDEDTNPSTGTLSVSCPCIPPAGGIDGSYSFDNDFVISGTTDGACNDCDLRSSLDRVYAVDIACAGTYNFTTCGGTSWDTYLYLTTAPCGGSIIAQNDDACGLQSSVTAALAPGTYYINVEAYSAFSFGAFDLAVSGTYDTPSIGGVEGTNELCAGSEGVSYSVAGDFTGYTWSVPADASIASGAGTSSITVNFGVNSGSVSVVATNNCGTNSSSMDVLVNRTPEFTTSTTDALCNGDANGTITINATEGEAPYTYSINGESTTESLIVDVSGSDNYIGYMNVFENPADPNPCCGGGYVFGSPWALSDVLSTLDAGANTITLQPNFNTYNASDAFWSDGNGNGNKIMEANTYLENGAWNGNDLTFSGSVVSNTIADGYTVLYFIKALAPWNGYQDVLNGSAIMTLPASGDFSVSVPASSLYDGLIVQVGFVVIGMNANPANADALGSVVVTGGSLANGTFTYDGLTAGDYTIGMTDNNGCVAHEEVVTINEPEVLTVDASGCGVVYIGAGLDYACATIGTTSIWWYTWIYFWMV